MNYRELDLNLLIALRALLSARSVSRAAEMLHIGQPACSAALSKLRNHFGDELLVMVNRQMLPTPLALQLERPVRESLAFAEAIAAMRSGFDPQVAVQRFSIICSDMVTKLILSHVVTALEHSAPNISLMIHSAAPLRSSRTLVEEALERRGADFVVLPDRYVPKEYSHFSLFSCDYSCIVWAGNPLVGKSLTRELFYSLKHVAPTFGDGRLMSVENEDAVDLLRQREFSTKSEFFLSLPALIRSTNYIATIPTALAHACARQFDLRVLPVPIQLPALSEVLVWPKRLNDDPANQWMREFIRECAVKHLSGNGSDKSSEASHDSETG